MKFGEEKENSTANKTGEFFVINIWHFRLRNSKWQEMEIKSVTLS